MNDIDTQRLQMLTNELAEATYALRMIEDGKRDELKNAEIPIFITASPRVMTLLYEGERSEVIDYVHALSLAIRNGVNGKAALPASVDEVLDARAAHWRELAEKKNAREAQRSHLSVVGGAS